MITVIYDEIFLAHKTFAEHPESPDRLKALIAKLKENDVNIITPDYSSYEESLILMVHSESYVEKFKRACLENESFFMHNDNSISKDSFEVALRNAYAHFFAADYIMSDEPKKIFVAGRPPGHHALPNKALGFCFFNNIALTAKYLQKFHGIERVLIFDFDVHHGNGTQEIFYEDNSVYFISVHEHPTFLFPGSGRFFEKGKGLGSGYTLNIPLKPGAGDDEFGKIFLEKILNVFYNFKPEILLVSAGFDGHKNDIIGDLEYTTSLYRNIGYAVKYLSNKFCEGHLLISLEGGYAPDVLADACSNFLDAVGDDKDLDIYDIFLSDEMFGIF